MKLSRNGLSLIEVIIAIGLVSLLFGAIYASYVSILDVVTNSGIRTEAATIASNQIEIIRNLPYDQVGTIGGIPSGVLPPTRTVTSTNGFTFSLQTYVRNIDDPFDGTLGGSPGDSSPNDYKLVELSSRCVSCNRSVPLVMTTTVAPKNLESGSSDGSLFINILDANGQPVPGATIQVVNASVTPSINLTDTTNASGVLQLIGAPTSTLGYAITVAKSGYSSERTYLIGDPLNPEPTSQYTHAGVVAQTIASKTFFIDKVSTTTFRTTDTLCRPIPNRDFSLTGQKTIGTNTIKFSSTSATDSNGQKVWSNLEWDVYAAALSGTGYDLVGTMPFSPFTLNPDSAMNFSFILATTSPNSLLVTVVGSSTGSGLTGSVVTLTAAGFSEEQQTGRALFSETDWSGGNFDSQDGGLDTTSVPGSIRLINGGGGYPTTTASWLISNSIDIGPNPVNFYRLEWTPESQPVGTAVRVQIASNNDNATWNFVGPDGTQNTYYDSPSAITSDHVGDRYFRYKLYLSTSDEAATPAVGWVGVIFSGSCVPSGQVLFQGLSSGSYTLTVNASGSVTSTAVSVGSGTNETTLAL